MPSSSAGPFGGAVGDPTVEIRSFAQRKYFPRRYWLIIKVWALRLALMAVDIGTKQFPAGQPSGTCDHIVSWFCRGGRCVPGRPVPADVGWQTVIASVKVPACTCRGTRRAPHG